MKWWPHLQAHGRPDHETCLKLQFYPYHWYCIVKQVTTSQEWRPTEISFIAPFYLTFTLMICQKELPGNLPIIMTWESCIQHQLADIRVDFKSGHNNGNYIFVHAEMKAEA